MLVVFLLMLLLWVVLIGFLAVATIWFQGYIYNEPVTQIYWRSGGSARRWRSFSASGSPSIIEPSRTTLMLSFPMGRFKNWLLRWRKAIQSRFLRCSC